MEADSEFVATCIIFDALTLNVRLAIKSSLLLRSENSCELEKDSSSSSSSFSSEIGCTALLAFECTDFARIYKNVDLNC